MKKLYLKTWCFNTYRILNEIRKEVEKMGGELVESFPYILKKEKILIYDRYYLEAERETKANLEKSSKLDNYNRKYYKGYYEAIKRNYKFKKIVICQNWLHFYYKGFIYYVEIDENPFFEHYIMKEKAEQDGEAYVVKYAYYIQELKNTIINKINSTAFISDKEIKKIAKKFLQEILEQKESEIVKTRKRVENLFNRGYHYETIKEEKISKYIKLEEEKKGAC